MPPDPSQEREWFTRKKRVDTRLKALGWAIVPLAQTAALSTYTHHAIEEYETANGPADYALVVNGRILGIVEAKKLSLGPQNVLVQAERYSRGATGNSLQFRDFHVPFLYSTNGEVLWFHDIRHPQSRSRRIADFHTPGRARGATRS
jgi:type I restriction enzyme R subunit